MSQGTIQKASFSLEESWTYLGVSRAELYRLMGQGDIPSFHIGRRRMCLKAHLDRFIQERLEAAGIAGG